MVFRVCPRVLVCVCAFTLVGGPVLVRCSRLCLAVAFAFPSLLYARVGLCVCVSMPFSFSASLTVCPLCLGRVSLSVPVCVYAADVVVLAFVLVFILGAICSWCCLRLRLCRDMSQRVAHRAVLVFVRAVAFVCVLVVVCSSLCVVLSMSSSVA
jgi:hypothetical protein